MTADPVLAARWREGERLRAEAEAEKEAEAQLRAAGFDWRERIYIDTAQEAVAERGRLDAVRAAALATRDPRESWRASFRYDARAFFDAGYDVIPQTRDRDRRRPMLGLYPSTWFNRRQTQAEFDALIDAEIDWTTTKFPTGVRVVDHRSPLAGKSPHNVAIVAKDLLVTDIDISDHDTSLEAERLIESALGQTAYKRIGRSPKINLVYVLAHQLTEAEKALLKTISTIVGNIEFLTGRSVVTVAGLHHATRQQIVWTTPLAPRDQLPQATVEGLKIARYLLERRFTPAAIRTPKAAAVALEALPSSIEGLSVPGIQRAGPWVRDEAAGLVVDGREKFVVAMCANVARANLAEGYTEEQRAGLLRVAFDLCASNVERTGRWATDERLLAQVRERLNRALDFKGWNSPIRQKQVGDLPPPVEIKKSDPFADMEAAFAAVGDPRPFVIPRRVNSRGEELPAKIIPAVKVSAAIEADRTKRALMSEAQRRPTHLAIQHLIQEAIESFMVQVVDALLGKELAGDAKTLLVKVPPGGGKSSGFVIGVLRWIERMIEAGTWPTGKKVVFYCPTYTMCRQMMAVAAGAGHRTMTWEDAAAPALVDGQPRALVALFGSKSEVPCERAEEMAALRKGGVDPRGLCEKQLKRTDYEKSAKLKAKTITCPFKLAATGADNGCPPCRFYRQEETMADAHLVFAVRAMARVQSKFLHNNTVGAIIDEDPTVELARVKHSFNADRLLGRSNEVIHNDAKGDELKALYDKRARINILVTAEIKARRNPAPAILAMEGGLECLEAAIDITRPDDWVSRQIRPDMDPDELAWFASAGIRLPGRSAERDLWAIVKQMVDEFQQHSVNLSAIEQMRTLAGRRAARTGGRDRTKQLLASLRTTKLSVSRLDPRLQWVQAERPDKTREWAIRVSRRKQLTPKLLRLPIAVLDATASVKRLTKAIGREVDVREIGDLIQHCRVMMDPTQTFSVSSFKIDSRDSEKQRKEKLQRRDHVRLLITLLAGLYSWGRGLVVAPTEVRDILQDQKWRTPSNIDWLHHGNVRGLDFAKRADWVVVVGRMQPTTGAMDGQGAAYGSDEPDFVAIDQRGDGTIDGKNPLHLDLHPRRYRMRNGNDVVCMAPNYAPNTWQRDFLEAAREEENFQIATRLRTVYRHGDLPPPLCIFLGPFAPENTIVDSMRRLADMVKGSEIADLARQRGLMSMQPAGFAVVDNQRKNGPELWDDSERAKAEALVTEGLRRWPDLKEEAAMWRMNRHTKRLNAAEGLLDDETFRFLENADEDRHGDWLWRLDEWLAQHVEAYDLQERPAAGSERYAKPEEPKQSPAAATAPRQIAGVRRVMPIVVKVKDAA
ncbi:hypothetical protein [Chenggangzhangella methanolivorans]|uniref:Uncharacterized protein n=2 Tax=Chenggangzhangella methanolivorans TaxID=1437009 RepID=A0A9E6RGK9_9HYPH|nr:hypothetical protein [Chenggangzhangella methanolivorans]QZO00637.1 hypothetical protein K6K41_02670 [Chenggangzhangella methanolivorans]